MRHASCAINRSKSPAQMVIARHRADAYHVVEAVDHRDVERAAAKVEHAEGLVRRVPVRRGGGHGALT